MERRRPGERAAFVMATRSRGALRIHDALPWKARLRSGPVRQGFGLPALFQGPARPFEPDGFAEAGGSLFDSPAALRRRSQLGAKGPVHTGLKGPMTFNAVPALVRVAGFPADAMEPFT